VLVVALSSCRKDYKFVQLQNPTKKISFASDIYPTLNSECNISGCHSGGVADAPPNLSSLIASYNSLKPGLLSTYSSPNGPYVDTINVTSSILYARINGGTVGNQMPDGGPPWLSATYINNVKQWIQQGAKNN